MVEVEHEKVSIDECTKVVDWRKGKVYMCFMEYLYYIRIIIEITQIKVLWIKLNITKVKECALVNMCRVYIN